MGHLCLRTNSYETDICIEVHLHLKRHNYRVELINDGIKRAKNIPLTQIRTTRFMGERQDEKIQFVTTHNQRNYNIFNSSKRYVTNARVIRKYKKELVIQLSVINNRIQALNLRKIFFKV